MNKLTISLTPQEVKILTHVLEYTLTSHDMNILKKERHNDYLALSCMHEFYNKIDKKNNEIIAFGYTPGKDIKVVMRRFEAIAFYNICGPGDSEEDSYLPAVPDSTQLLILGIIGDIDKTFFV